MEAVMKSWTEKAVISPEPAQRVVRRALRLRHALGWKQDAAFEDTATALGTTARRVRSLIRGEVFKVAIEEYRAFVRRQWTDVDQQTAELYELANRLQNEAESEWSAQFQLSFELSDPNTQRGGRNAVSSVPVKP